MAFQFPSLSAVVKGALDTLRRFPLAVAASILATGISIYMLEMKWDVQKEFEYLWKIIMCCWLGLSLFLAFSLFSERRDHSVIQKYILQMIALALVIAYYFLLPEFKKMTVADITRYILFSTGLHLLVSFSPFIARGEINGFWQFNKTLFLRFLLSVLYSGVLYMGLSLALVAVDQLFGAEIRGERYGQLWCVLAGVFNTWFFLSGIPKNLDELEVTTDYPKGLKIFTQFVLLPLVTIYLIILYAYGIKILYNWELPKGWVSWLVNAFSVFGILSLLLIWPIRNDEGNKWISTFSKWFYMALFPLIVLLGVAIGKRVMEYGITENRYFVLVVALWLAGIAFYFLFSKTKNIKTIPVTLCVIAFLSSFGPWGAFSVSEISQVNRLEKLLIEEKILVDGKIVKATDTVSDKNGRQIVSIVHYLDDQHGFDGIRPWFEKDMDSLLAPKDSNDYVYETGKVLALMGVEDNYYYYRGDEENDTSRVKDFYYYAQNDNQFAMPVEEYDFICNYNRYFYDDNAHYNESYYLIRMGSDSGTIKYSKEKKNFVFSMNGKPVLNFSMDVFVTKLGEYNKENKKSQYDRYIPGEKMLFEAKNDSVRMKIYVSNISGNITNGEIKINDVNGMLLLGFGTDTLRRR